MGKVPNSEDCGIYRGACLNHTDAEGEHREDLSQKFIALASIVPSVTKMEEVSILRDSIKYIKELQAREKVLEEQAAKNTIDEQSFESSNEPLLDIKAELSDRSVLIRIRCEKQKGVMSKVVAEMEKLNLSVIHSSSIPFGTSTIEITTVAQMEEKSDMTHVDIAEILQSSCRRFL